MDHLCVSTEGHLRGITMTIMVDKHTIVMRHWDGAVEKVQTEGYEMALYLCRLLCHRRTHVKINTIEIYNLNGDLVNVPYDAGRRGKSLRP